MAKETIRIPYNFEPRPYQVPVLEAFDSGYKRGVLLAHRRMGKDKTAINLIAKKMLERVGTYYYVFPTYRQGRKVIWNGIDGNGFRFIDHIPEALRARTNDQEMFIQLKNGSIFQVVGTDSLDGIIGTNPVGCVFSEYPLHNPEVWAFVRLILRENGGWALFVYTPRGKQNHGYDLWQLAQNNPREWWSLKLSAEDTKVLTKEQLELERKEYIQQYGDDIFFRQEYFCDFNVTVTGTFYSQQLEIAEADGRIKDIPYDSQLPVHTAWDLGVGDSNAIWFFQMYGSEIRLIDYYEAQGEGMQHYFQVLQQKKYTYGTHFAPHDIGVREYTTGVSRIETAKKLGFTFTPVQKLGREDGIHAVRQILSRCWFDKVKCKRGLECLSNYRKEWNDKMKVFKTTPLHDEFSNGADGFRYLAVGIARKDKLEQAGTNKKMFIPNWSKKGYGRR